MTIEINEQRRSRALTAPSTEAAGRERCSRLIIGIWVSMLIFALAGFVFAGFDLAAPAGERLAVFSAASFVMAGLCGGLICLHRMMADRQDFYRRGQLDGWMRGWRGQEPELDDPLLR